MRVPDLAGVAARSRSQLAQDVSRDLAALLGDPATARGLHRRGGRRSGGARGGDPRRPRHGGPRDRRPAGERDLGGGRRSHGRRQLARPGDPRPASRRESSPATARAPAVQHLAGLVAARAGQPRVFAAAPTVPAAGPVPDRAQPFATAPAAAPAGEVARLMQQVPALKTQGLSLQGDLQRARGDVSGARRTYHRGGGDPPVAVDQRAAEDGWRRRPWIRRQRRVEDRPANKVRPGAASVPPARSSALTRPALLGAVPPRSPPRAPSRRCLSCCRLPGSAPSNRPPR